MLIDCFVCEKVAILGVVMDLLHNQKCVYIQSNYLGLLIYIKSYFLSTIYINSIADGSSRFRKPHF